MKTIDEKLGYIMLGYEKSIASLSFLDYKSEAIQTLVSLIFQLQCSDDNGNVDYTDTALKAVFAKEHTEAMMSDEAKYLDLFSLEQYEYLLRAISHFGNN